MDKRNKSALLVLVICMVITGVYIPLAIRPGSEISKNTLPLITRLRPRRPGRLMKRLPLPCHIRHPGNT